MTTMKTDATLRHKESLRDVLSGIPELRRGGAVAVSGGVDSMTLAVIAGRQLGRRIEMFHALSPAVPPAATERVRRYAAREGWGLQLIDAGEFANPNYLSNPVNRCFYCKTHLYTAIGRATQAVLLSGTNCDDLGDYRPGLAAARDHAVRHPYVEAGIDKSMVRAIAASLGLHDLAELPSAPCLSSRVETGIAIEAKDLRLIDAVERHVTREVEPTTVRCRIRQLGVVIELDSACLESLQEAQRTQLTNTIQTWCREAGLTTGVRFEPYRMGSAFRHDARAAQRRPLGPR